MYISLSVRLGQFLIKDVNIKRFWPIHTVQTSNILRFRSTMYGEVLYLEVFSEPLMNDEVLPDVT